MAVSTRSFPQRLGFVFGAALTIVAAAAQDWTQEQLRERSRDFLLDGDLDRLRQVAVILRDADPAYPALCTAIRGDHREYALKVERLLDQLADDRWLSREDAERTLVEMGARGLTQIHERSEVGGTLEERIRSKRVLAAIAARGTEEEEREIDLLRGYVLTASYLDNADATMITALRSALGHTEPSVVEITLIALGAVGGAEQAAELRSWVQRDGGTEAQRQSALAGLGRLRDPAAIGVMVDLINGEGGRVAADEAVALLTDLRARADAGDAVQRLADHSDPAIAALAALGGRAEDGAGVAALLQIVDGSEVEVRLEAITGFDVVAGGLIEGLPKARMPRNRVAGIQFAGTVAVPAGLARVFLEQGSLLVGELLSLDGERLRLRSSVFGDIEVPRSEIQGVALDPEVDRLLGASPDHDRIRTATGELLDGQIVGLDGRALLLATATDAEPRRVPLESAAGLLFRRPMQGGYDNRVFTRIDTLTGDRLLVYLGDGSLPRLGVFLPGVGSASLDIASVRHIEFGVGGGALWGFTLIADYAENRVVEVDERGKELFELTDIYGVWDVECLDNGNLLVTEFALNRVVEITREGVEVWVFEDLLNPYDADALPNGNVLIADTFHERVIEVNRVGEIVWKIEGVKAFDVEMLADGHVLVADDNADRIVEFDRSGNVRWELRNLPNVHDVDRLPNGHYLVTQRSQGRVVELDRDGKTVFLLEDLSSPGDADRLPNGHTLVAENGIVREFDRGGKVVWSCPAAWAVEVNRY